MDDAGDMDDAGGMGSIPAPGGFHMLRGSKAQALQLQVLELVLPNERRQWSEKPERCNKDPAKPKLNLFNSTQSIKNTQSSGVLT